MSISYEVLCDGHFIRAVASGAVTGADWVEYEIVHAIDERLKPPVCEMLRIDLDSYKNVTRDGLLEVLERRKELTKRPVPHRCAILVGPDDIQAWNLANLYEGMKSLHRPESVIVFGDERTAKIWLGLDDPDYR